MLQNHPFPENQANQLLANCNKTTKRNTKEPSFFLEQNQSKLIDSQNHMDRREIVNIVNIHTVLQIKFYFLPKK